MPSRLLALVATSAVVVLSACLLQANASILYPIYGSLPVSHALAQGINLGLLVAAVTASIGGGAPKLLANSTILATCAVSVLPVVTYLLRLSCYAYSFAGLSAAVVVPLLTGPILALFSGVAMRMSIDAAPPGLKLRIRNGVLPSSSDNLFTLAVIALVPAAYRILSYSLPSVLRGFALFSAEYLGHSIPRWEMQAWLSLALSLVITTRMNILSTRLVVFQLLAWSPHAFLSLSHSRETAANARLAPAGFKLVESKESVTGYLSVVENTRDGFRVLRNDHSLLGGQWLLTTERQNEGIQVAESIYGVFHMLEAVRLMEVDEKSPRTADQREALVIGLGIGTAPSALAAHGVSTTAVEIDPVVTDFALRYFQLNPDIKVINEDAQTFIAHAAKVSRGYDYIIHDVFTGGEEPAALFSDEFLQKLRTLLKPWGTIAINYAGDLNSTTTYEALTRILDTFTHCSIYRDNPPIDVLDSSSDFANIVTFCAHQPWNFRAPVDADYLLSQTRPQYLVPQHEISRAVLTKRMALLSTMSRDKQDEALESAIDHWKIMRQVIPDVFWENW